MNKVTMGLAGLAATTVLASLAFAQPASTDLGSIGAPGTLSDTYSLTPGLIRWYRFTLTTPISNPTNFLDIGTLSNAGTPVNTDTEIGLYRDDGTLVNNDDDSGPDQFSELSYGTTCPTRPSTQPPLPAGVTLAGQSGATLPAGTYYLAVAGFNATFGATAWNVTTTGTGTGEVRVFLNCDVASAPAPSFTAGSATPGAVLGGGTTLLTATVATCGAAGIAVTADLSALGGSATEPMFDDGTHGDATAGNNVWSLSYAVPGGATPGAYNVVITGTTATPPAATRSVALTVIGPPTYTEVEPNDNKAAANLIGSLAAGESLSGATTGTSTTVAGAASADNFRLKTVAAPLAIYRHRMTLETNGATGHTATIRGLSQAAGVIGTTDSTMQTGATVGTSRLCQWYGFGKQEEIYYRVTGTTSTTGNYYSQYSRATVTPTVVSSDIIQGPVTISRDPANTNTVDFWVYNANLDPIATFGNEASNTMTRTFAPGTYYLAVSNVNTANDQPSPTDSTTRTGIVLDFPNALANSSTTTLTNLNMQFAHAGGTSTVAGAKSGAFDVVWYEFHVVQPANPVGSGLANPASVAITGSTLLTVAVTPAGSPASTGLGVVADLSTINGSSTQAFFDDGSHGDVTAGDNIFSFQATLAEPQSAGGRTLPFTVSDAQGRSSAGNISLTATAAPTGSCCTLGNCTTGVTAYNCTQGGGTYNGNASDCTSSTGATFSSNNSFPIAIPDFNTTPGTASSTLTVPAGSGNISNLAVTVGLNHTWMGDIILTLSNGSTTVTLVNRPGVPATTVGFSDNYTGTYVFVDSAAADLWSVATNVTGHDIPSGTYHPSGAGSASLPSPSLSAFAGTPIEGTWTLTATDNAGVDTGSFTSFSIRNLLPLVCPPGCGTADFNCDGDVGTDADIEAFFACLAGTCPAAPCTNNADFNADGDVGTDADIESFFRVLSGGNC